MKRFYASYYGLLVERLRTATPDSWSDDMTAASQKSCTDDEHGSERLLFPRLVFDRSG